MGDEKIHCGVLGCEKVFDNRFALYRHNRDVHHPRFCLYCSYAEGRGFVLRKHIEKEHPTVRLPEKSRKVKLYRTEGIPPLPIPPASAPSVSDVFPAPPGYEPFTEDDIASGSFEYIPTPIVQCSSSSSAQIQSATPHPTPSTSSSKKPGVSSSSAVPSTSFSKPEKTASTSSCDPNSDRDHDLDSGTEYEIVEESSEEQSTEAKSASNTLGHQYSTGVMEQDSRRVISIEDYRTRKIEERQVEEMQEAIATLISTAGYQSLLKEVRQSFSSPVESLHEITRRIKLTLDPRNLEESGTQEGEEKAVEGHRASESEDHSIDTVQHQSVEKDPELHVNGDKVTSDKVPVDGEYGNSAKESELEVTMSQEAQACNDNSVMMEKELIVKLMRVDEQGENEKMKMKRKLKSTEKDHMRSGKRKHGVKHSKVAEKRKHGVKHSKVAEKRKHGRSEKKERRGEKEEERSEKSKSEKLDSGSRDALRTISREMTSLAGRGEVEQNQDEEDAAVTSGLPDGMGAEEIFDDNRVEETEDVTSGLPDGMGAEEILDDNRVEEAEDVTLCPVDGEGAVEILDENRVEEAADAMLGPLDGEKQTCEDREEKHQDEEDGEIKLMKRSQNWQNQEAPKRMRIVPPPRSSLVEPYMAEPAGLDLRVERTGPRGTSDVVQLPPAPPHRLHNPVAQRFYCACRCHCRCGSCCGCHCICEWIRVIQS